MLPLFKAFPRLSERVAYSPLGKFPTPAVSLDGLSKQFNRPGLYVKRDDLSGNPYGGNKVRKLEFILADAVKKPANITKIETAMTAEKQSRTTETNSFFSFK